MPEKISNIIIRIIAWLGVGFIFGELMGLIYGPEINLWAALIAGVVAGLIGGLINAIWAGLISSVIFGLAFGLISANLSWGIVALIFGLTVGALTEPIIEGKLNTFDKLSLWQIVWASAGAMIMIYIISNQVWFATGQLTDYSNWRIFGGLLGAIIALWLAHWGWRLVPQK